MDSCKEVKNRKYQTRKSPAYHAGQCKGLQKNGKDGLYISKATRGIYKWIKVSKTRKRKGKFYDTHDNGSKAFRVYVDGKKIAIYKGKYSEGDEIHFDKLVKELTVKDIYIGKPEGNSILLKIAKNRYMHIGTEVYEFDMDDKVDHYFSMIGNSDVPYPVLLGTENVYFMIDGDHTYIPRDKFPSNLTMTQWKNAYSYYYGHIDPETDTIIDRKNVLQKFVKKMKGFKMIHKREF
jgi:hypothetical protein